MLESEVRRSYVLWCVIKKPVKMGATQSRAPVLDEPHSTAALFQMGGSWLEWHDPEWWCTGACHGHILMHCLAQLWGAKQYPSKSWPTRIEKTQSYLGYIDLMKLGKWIKMLDPQQVINWPNYIITPEPVSLLKWSFPGGLGGAHYWKYLLTDLLPTHRCIKCKTLDCIKIRIPIRAQYANIYIYICVCSKIHIHSQMLDDECAQEDLSAAIVFLTNHRMNDIHQKKTYPKICCTHIHKYTWHHICKNMCEHTGGHIHVH